MMLMFFNIFFRNKILTLGWMKSMKDLPIHMSLGNPRVAVNEDVVYITTPSCMEITQENPSCKKQLNLREKSVTVLELSQQWPFVNYVTRILWFLNPQPCPCQNGSVSTLMKVPHPCATLYIPQFCMLQLGFKFKK